MIEGTDFERCLAWIDDRHDRLVRDLVRLAEINSGSYNRDGLERMASELTALFGCLESTQERLELPDAPEIDDDGATVSRPLGPLLRMRKRDDAPLRVLLVGHMDTVFGPSHPSQKTRALPENRLGGPGVADLKGGLLVMLTALTALERSPWAQNIGWEVLINPDEEIGSPGSIPYLLESAGRCAIGLVYEPAMPDGALARARKGSGNFSAVFKGRAAHAGREIHLGRNAIRAAADFASTIDDLNGKRPGVTVNAGRIHGGGAVNVVPDLATVHFNVRVETEADQGWVEERLESLRSEIDARDGIGATLQGQFSRPPKAIDAAHQRLFDLLRTCADALEVDLDWRDTGGCCDGNNLSAAGLPNVDTLGVVGGGIHGAEEYVELDSLTARARLSALLLMGLASGRLQWDSVGGARS